MKFQKKYKSEPIVIEVGEKKWEGEIIPLSQLSFFQAMELMPEIEKMQNDNIAFPEKIESMKKIIQKCITIKDTEYIQYIQLEEAMEIWRYINSDGLEPEKKNTDKLHIE